MDSLDAFAQAKIDALEAEQLKRTLKEDERQDDVWITRAGRRLISFSCNDYLNLSHDPRVKQAAADAALRYGAGAAASRLITGNHPLVRELERALARFKRTDDACVFGAGYLANVGIPPCFVKKGDLVLIDDLAHACLWTGARLSGAEVHAFAHNEVDEVRDVLERERDDYERVLVLTDGVFSMDGDLAPLDQLSELCIKHDAWLMSDDAHGLGVVGGGRGAAHFFPGARIPLQMGTLSKAAGSFGGYLCASQPVIDLVRTRARTFIYSTGLPPASAGAALKALEIIESEPELVARPIKKARRFTRALNLPDAQSAIVPILMGDADRALKAQQKLEEDGFLVVAIRPPTVPAGTARLRFAFTAAHGDDDIDRLAQSVRPLL
jgi:8-amino-7-oxononanoate synthase